MWLIFILMLLWLRSRNRQFIDDKESRYMRHILLKLFVDSNLVPSKPKQPLG